jgi:signal peptidase II
MTSPTRARRGWLPIAIGLVVADQITKAWALDALDDRDIDLVWTLRLNLSFNTGMAFSAGENMGPVIGVVAMVVIVALLLSLRRQSNRLTDIAVGLIVGGAVGNLIDRLFREPGWLRGAVIDFIDFQWFPIFNVADMGITIGGALLVIGSWQAGRELDRAEAEHRDGSDGATAVETGIDTGTDRNDGEP